MKYLFPAVFFLIFLTGCDSYRPEKLPKGSVLETGTVIATTVNRSLSVVANQSDTVYLKVESLFGKKVRDLLIEAEVQAMANTGTAIIKPQKLRISAGAVPLSGSAYTKANDQGLAIGCGEEDPSRCGFFEIEKGTEILVKLTQSLDLGGIVITTAEMK
jgi:hypothetical protein